MIDRHPVWLRTVLAIAVAIAWMSAAGSAYGATAAVTGTGANAVITISYTTGTNESVTVDTTSTNWVISGNVTGTLSIPMATSCAISVGGGNDGDIFNFLPTATITNTLCSGTKFSLKDTTSNFAGSTDLSGTVHMTSGTNVVDLQSPITLFGATTFDLAGGSFTTAGTIDGPSALTITGASALIASGVGSGAPPTNLTLTTTGACTLMNEIDVSGALAISGDIGLILSWTVLRSDTLTLGGSVKNLTTGSTATLMMDVANASSSTATLGGATAIDNDLGIEKRGAGTLTLGGANTYTGATTVTAGTLIANTSGALGAATEATTVASGARLQFNAIGSNSEPITLAGSSTLAAAGGSVSSLAGQITLLSGVQTVNVASGATLVLGGGLDGLVNGSGTVSVTGVGQLTVGSSGIGVTHPIASFASSSSGRFRIGGNVTSTGAVTLDGTVESWTTTATVTGAPVSGAGTIDNGNGAAGSTLTIDSGTEPNTLSGAIGSGAGDATKVSLVLAGGSGHTLSAATSGFTGSLTVQAGGLIVGGTLTHPSSTTIASGATVSGSGSGTIGSAVSLASGSAGFGIGAGLPYRLTTGSLTSSTVVGYLNVVVDGTAPGTGYTQIVSTGSANLAGLNVWSDGFEAPIGTVITPVTTATGITGTLAGKPEGSYYGYWQISYAANGGKDMTWTFVGDAPNPTAVSPSTSAPAGGGTLTVTGAPLYDGTTVTVGGAACTNATRISISELTCTLPAHAVGAADVVVTNGTRSATLTGAVTYTVPADPAVTAASASGGGTTTRTLAIGTPRLVGTKLVTTITAPGAGAVRQTAVTRKGRKATTYCTVRRPVAAAADLTITCALNARARAALRRSSLRLTVTTTFTPTGGAPTTRVAKVKAKRATTGKRTLLL